MSLLANSHPISFFKMPNVAKIESAVILQKKTKPKGGLYDGNDTWREIDKWNVFNPLIQGKLMSSWKLHPCKLEHWTVMYIPYIWKQYLENDTFENHNNLLVIRLFSSQIAKRQSIRLCYLYKSEKFSGYPSNIKLALRGCWCSGFALMRPWRSL